MELKIDEELENRVLEHINLTPLIDIMLVLLIIFMLTSSVTLESGLDIDIPKTQTKTDPKEANAIIVSLSRNGEIFVQGHKVLLENLKSVIKKTIAETKADVVVFEGDAQSQLGKAIEIMDIAKDAGAQKFAIAAEYSTK